MNLAHRSRYLTMISCLAFVTLAGCAEYKAENPALTEYPGIQSQIENFYDANAIEDDWACDSPQMQGIDKSKVVGQTASQVRMAITYYFRSTGNMQAIDRSEVVGQTASQVRMAIAYYFRSTALQEGQGADYCQGFNTRFFTFDKGSGGQLSLVKMSGPQRGGGA